MDELLLELVPTAGALSISLWNQATQRLSARCEAPFDGVDSLEARFERALQDSQSLVTFGAELAGIVYPPEVREHLRDCLKKGPVNLRLRVDDRLASLPIEGCYIEGLGFLSVHPGIRMFREAPAKDLSPADAEEIRVLIVTANPDSAPYPYMPAIIKELRSIGEALASPDCRRCRVDVLEGATPVTLERKIRSSNVDVFIFLGHGTRFPTGGALVLEGAVANEHSFFYADELSSLLCSAGVKLVVLSSCSTGGHSASLGADISRAGVHSVVAMQYPIGDDAAHVFNRALCAALSEGTAIAECVRQARKSILGGTDLVAPVLITGDANATLFPRRGLPSRGNLPPRLMSVVGRTREIQQISEILKDEHHVTLLGSGGIGKTTLSLEIGRSVAGDFEHGAWQVELETATTLEQVVASVGSVFGMRDSEQASVGGRLIDFLKNHHLLLILDNCEQAVDPIRQFINRLLRECPEVRVLSTSRTVLETEAGILVQVLPLSFPKLPNDRPLTDQERASLDDFEAPQLFIERAEGNSSQFRVDPESLEVICRITERLDGIPLAIELAASRVRMLSVRQILARLEREFELLELGRPGNIERHQTMRATLDWSYALLSQEEKRFLDRLSLFEGGFDLDTVEQVVVDEYISPGACFALLGSLVDKSLVLTVEQYGFMRYRLLDTTKRYASARLGESGDLSYFKARHLAAMRKFVSDNFIILAGGEQERWRKAVEVEHENALAAIEWALGYGAAPTEAAELARDLYHYWFMFGRLALAHRILGRVLEALQGSTEPITLVIRALFGATRVYLGDRDGLLDLGRARNLCENIDDPVGYQIVSWLAECAYMLQEYDLAETHFLELLDRAKRLNRRQSEGYVRLSLGNILVRRGEIEGAKAQYKLLLEAKTDEHDDRGCAYGLFHLGYLEWREGIREHRQRFFDGVEYLARVSDYFSLAQYLVLASIVLVAQSPKDAAAVIGYADGLLESSSGTPDGLVKDWGIQVRQAAELALPRSYGHAYKSGRTLGLEHVVSLFRRARKSDMEVP